jgi:2-polyprenyl-3-methyl-5-hydroxy-6-metoxy-1,4-benzoquinol methylase
VGKLDVVEATPEFLAEARARRLRNVSLHEAMIEDFRPQEQYDRIFATWILTHLLDSGRVLEQFRSWLKPGGLLLVAVPNVRVLSRQWAQKMGYLEDLYALTENDRNHGHLRAYDRQRLNRELTSRGYDIVEQGGLMLKPFADFQMDELYASGLLGETHIEGLFRLGREYPDLASAIYAVCRVRP